MQQEKESLGPFLFRPGAGGCPLSPTVLLLPLFSSCNPSLSYTCLINKASVLFPSHNSENAIAYNPVWRDNPLLPSKCVAEGWSQVL